MPTRKSGSSDVTQPDRRASLRRLSSIASLQALFSRRRSNNATDNTNPASSSTLSLSSTLANALEPCKPVTNSTEGPIHLAGDKEDSLTDLPKIPPVRPSAQIPPRKSSYVCLPDDPVGGMPRSRTFSNLPLPTRKRKALPLSQSESKARLPSTRLPSPPASTRKHSHSRWVSADRTASLAPSRARTQRSDTEPLLKTTAGQRQNLPRSTAFKENISLSPIKRLPTISMFDDEDASASLLPSRANAANFHLSDSESSFANHPASQITCEATEYRTGCGVKDRRPTPGDPELTEATSSKLKLANATNARDSHHAEIKQVRLMSARQAPTPPQPKTPLSTQPVDVGRLRSRTNSSVGLARIANLAGFHSSSSPSRALHESSPSVEPDISRITAAEPPAYWCGRLSTLADRYRNEELAVHLLDDGASNSSKPASSAKQALGPDATTVRIRRALQHLYDLCDSSEAREALGAFQRQYALAVRNPELSRPIVLGSAGCDAMGRKVDGVGGGAGRREKCSGSTKSAGPRSEGRKASFMDRLLGKQKRRSLALA